MEYLRGRTNRATYWLSLGLLVAILGLLYATVGTPPQLNEAVLILLAIPRLHDIGRTGGIAGGVFAIDIALVLALGFSIRDEALRLEAYGVLNLAIMALLIWLGAIRGDPNANYFGAPPAPGIAFRRR